MLLRLKFASWFLGAMVIATPFSIAKDDDGKSAREETKKVLEVKKGGGDLTERVERLEAEVRELTAMLKQHHKGEAEKPTGKPPEKPFAKHDGEKPKGPEKQFVKGDGEKPKAPEKPFIKGDGEKPAGKGPEKPAGKFEPDAKLKAALAKGDEDAKKAKFEKAAISAKDEAAIKDKFAEKRAATLEHGKPFTNVRFMKGKDGETFVAVSSLPPGLQKEILSQSGAGDSPKAKGKDDDGGKEKKKKGDDDDDDDKGKPKK
jgi:hypothetical protein